MAGEKNNRKMSRHIRKNKIEQARLEFQEFPDEPVLLSFFNSPLAHYYHLTWKYYYSLDPLGK